MFTQANALRKTIYQKATQVPRVGSNSIYIAVNPSQRPAPAQPQQQLPQTKQSPLGKPAAKSLLLSSASSSSSSSVAVEASSASADSLAEQVSILVRPQKGGKPVLLNVPRKVAVKVKIGTTLSFSASNDQKYVVLSSKIHAAVGQDPPKPPKYSLNAFSTGKSFIESFAGNLPASLSLEPVSSSSSSSSLSVSRRRPAITDSGKSNPEPAAKARKSSLGVLSTGEM